MHEQSVHGSRKYLCNSCNFQANTADDLRTHQKSVHIKGKFKCDQCDIDFSHKESNSKHKHYIQKKIVYPCSQCDYLTNQKKHLKVHTNSWVRAGWALQAGWAGYQIRAGWEGWLHHHYHGDWQVCVSNQWGWREHLHHPGEWCGRVLQDTHFH